MKKLPIDEVIPLLLESIQTQHNLIVHAPPGAGKTTRVPLALLDAIPASSGRIIMLEPRRIAAVAAASWMARCLGEDVGRTVGYSIRFDSCTSSSTRIEVVTEGILTRRIQGDPGLSGVALVIFDEFHERSIHADLGLALCREVQQLRGDLKIMVMSATLDLQPLSRLLDNAPVISSSGRSFPVSVQYIDDREKGRLPQRMAAAVQRALRDTTGDILAFLPGVGEIRVCAAQLSALAGDNDNVMICQLYGDLPVAQQQQVIQADSRRKVVLATSIAETSLTIEGVRTVIDSGVSRRLQCDPGTGLNRLVTVRESRASAEQRAGRAGRTAPGVCYRLFTPHTLQAMTPHTAPEITTADLSQLLLELAAWGVDDPLQLGWLDPPPQAALAVARNLLAELDLSDRDGRITALGSEVVRLPLHPRLGRLLLRSRELGCTAVGCQVAALLSERDIFRNGADIKPRRKTGSDVADRLDVLNRWCAGGRADQDSDVSVLKRVERVAVQLMRLAGAANRKTHDYSEETVSRLLLASYPDRLARRRDAGNGYLLVSGRGARISERSGVKDASYIVAPVLDGGKPAEALVHLAAEVTEDIVRAERSGHFRLDFQVWWDEREQRVIARRMEILGAIEIAGEAVVPPPAEAITVVIATIRAARMSLLTLNDALRQLQGRLSLLHNAFPEQDWPDVCDAALCNTLEQWLAPYLEGVYSAKRLAQLNIAEILWQSLDYKQQRQLDEMTPTHLTVPSGSRIRTDYSGEAPVLAVKLQELFGLATGPSVCGGRTPVLLHLLSPAGRPIQVTKDLRGFWDGSYREVKKEMKGRYPKHPWPDDPWSAVPTRRVKNKP